jgi:aryl-alcohol dehydrogenase-like predicted oxidoreductase
MRVMVIGVTVRYRRFGNAGWNVSEISFGAWQLGGQWGAVDDDESVATLLAAFEAGVDFVDTAQMYGSGRSERIVGRSLRMWSGGVDVRVATKAQPVRWPDAADPDPRMADLYPDGYLVDQAEQSLRRLGVERIDVFQLHCWAPDGMVDRRWLDALEKLRASGKIDRIGVSIRDYRPEDGVELARSGLVDSIQVIYNIFEPRPAAALFPAAAESGTAIIARVALDSGALSGAWTPETYASWAEGSVLHTMFRDGRFAETLRRVDALRATTKPHYDSLAEAAVRFVLDAPEVSTVILGMSSKRRIAENVAYSDGRGLAPRLRGQLRRHEWRRNFDV